MRYVSDQVISFSIKVKGKAESRRVSFIAQSTGGSSFTTDIPVLIEALESSTMFGSLYNRAPECAEVYIKKIRDSKPTLKKRVVEQVNDWQDAIDYLAKYDIEHSCLNCPAKILEEAAKLGIEFPKLVMKG